MFTHPTDLSYRRSPLEALGFYIVYLVLILALSASVAYVTNFFSNDPELALWASRFFGGLAITVLSFSLLRAKELTKQPGLVLLAFISGVLSLYLSPPVGLLVAAYLSTR